MSTQEYIDDVLAYIRECSPGQEEFYQAATEVFSSLTPLLEEEKRYRENSILERIILPERSIIFRVTWMDDSGKIRTNLGYRVQFNSALGPYKGGLRFHPTVTLGVIKFLGFEQIFKNALTNLQIGAGKGGSNFDPKGKSDNEIMRFCQAFMNELYRHIGETRNRVGRFVRPERGDRIRVGLFRRAYSQQTRSGTQKQNLLYLRSGKRSHLHHRKAQKYGSDSDHLQRQPGNHPSPQRYRYQNAQSDQRGRPGISGSHAVWAIPCDIAFPSATQNELTLTDAENLVRNGCRLVNEGANMPTTPEAIEYLQEHGVLFGPAKAANAGGVAVSQLEMAQNASMQRWSFAEVDTKLFGIMKTIFETADETAREFGREGDLRLGANIAGFRKAADAMIDEGAV